MDLLPQLRSLFVNVGTLIREIKNAIQKQPQAKDIVEEGKRNQPLPPDMVHAIVSFDDETVTSTKAEADRQYRTQNSIKIAAWWAFAAASLYAFIAALQSCQMYRQSLIASKALQQSSESFITSQKAYITVGRQDGTVAEIVMPNNPIDKASLLVYFQNTGHLPAKFNWGSDSGTIAVLPGDPNAVKESDYGSQWLPFDTDHIFKPMWRGKNLKQANSFSWSGTIEIAGNSSYEGILWEIPKERMLQLMKWDRPFIADGKFDYCDGFGRRVCRKFFLQYFRNPYNRFLLVSEDECTQWEMQILRPDPNIEYLNPCELEGSREELKARLLNSPNP